MSIPYEEKYPRQVLELQNLFISIITGSPPIGIDPQDVDPDPPIWKYLMIFIF